MAFEHLSRVQEVRPGRNEGMRTASVANLDSVSGIAKRRPGERIGQLAARRETEVKRALGYALGWPELKVLG